MNYQNPLKVTVRCPKNQRDHAMYVAFSGIEKDFPLPVNGCDDSSGDETCKRCSAAVTLMFYHGYEYSPLKAISPDFSLLK